MDKYLWRSYTGKTVPLEKYKIYSPSSRRLRLVGLRLCILTKGWLEGAKLGMPQTNGFQVMLGKADEFQAPLFPRLFTICST